MRTLISLYFNSNGPVLFSNSERIFEYLAMDISAAFIFLIKFLSLNLVFKSFVFSNFRLHLIPLIHIFFSVIYNVIRSMSLEFLCWLIESTCILSVKHLPEK